MIIQPVGVVAKKKKMFVSTVTKLPLFMWNECVYPAICVILANFLFSVESARICKSFRVRWKKVNTNVTNRNRNKETMSNFGTWTMKRNFVKTAPAHNLQHMRTTGKKLCRAVARDRYVNRQIWADRKIRRSSVVIFFFWPDSGHFRLNQCHSTVSVHACSQLTKI